MAIVHPEDDWNQPGCAVAAADLERIPLILRERGSGTRNVVELALKKAGVSLRKVKIAMELNSSESIKSAVEAGLGVGFVSQWALRKERKLGTLGIVRIPGVQMKRYLNFLHVQGPEPSGVAGSFLQFAREYSRALSLTPLAKDNKKDVYS